MTIQVRWLHSLLFASLTCFAGLAEANCDGDHVFRSFIGQPPDLVFTAGQPATQYVPQVWAIWSSPVGASDCGASAQSTVPGITVQRTYCDWSASPTQCTVAQKEAVDDASGPLGIYVSREENHIRPVAIHYDGSAPAGTVGQIEFGQTEETGAIVSIRGVVNVRFVAAGQSAPTWFLVTTQSGNIVGDAVALDSPLLNGNPEARLFAQHKGQASPWNHPIAVLYDAPSERWRIRNEDSTPMPAGLSFLVHVDPSAKVLRTGRFFQRHYLVIDDPVANNNPYSVIIATPLGSSSGRMAHPYGVAYVEPHWQILFTDGQSMPRNGLSRGPGAGFMVKVLGGGQYVDDGRTGDPSGFQKTELANGVGIDLAGVGTDQTSGAVRRFSRFCATRAVALPALATYNMTPLPPPAPVNYNFVESKFLGVDVVNGVAAVFHQDQAPVAETKPFNVWAPYAARCPPGGDVVDTDRPVLDK